MFRTWTVNKSGDFNNRMDSTKNIYDQENFTKQRLTSSSFQNPIIGYIFHPGSGAVCEDIQSALWEIVIYCETCGIIVGF